MTSSWVAFHSFSFFSASVYFLCNMPDSSRVLQVRFVRYINEKTHLHRKTFIRSRWGKMTLGMWEWGRACSICERASEIWVCPPLKCRQCDTFITGDINELNLKLRNSDVCVCGGGGRKCISRWWRAAKERVQKRYCSSKSANRCVQVCSSLKVLTERWRIACCWHLPHHFHWIPGSRFLETLRCILIEYYLISQGWFLFFFLYLFHE